MEVSVSILSEKDNYINAIKKIDKTSASISLKGDVEKSMSPRHFKYVRILLSGYMLYLL